jgi:hypothetical protein
MVIYMIVRLALVALLASSSIAIAQQTTPDPAIVQRVLETTKAQRNQFLDAFTAAAARVDALSEELTKANAKIKELEDKQNQASPAK